MDEMPSVITVDADLREVSAVAHDSTIDSDAACEVAFVLFNAGGQGVLNVLDCGVESIGATLDKFWPFGKTIRRPVVRDCTLLPPWDVPDNSYDVICCTGLSGDLPLEDARFLMAVWWEKLAYGGRLIITSRDAKLSHTLSSVVRDDAESRDTRMPWRVLEKVWPGTEISGGSVPLNCNNAKAFFGLVLQKGDSTFEKRTARIGLGMLTWNTRRASVDSLCSLILEAEMLSRLGYVPHLIICDNGSDDGTAESLKEHLSTAKVGYSLLINESNYGNSVARNQIIRCAMEHRDDYLLLIDGDIEIIPFSSVAMLRYLEDIGVDVGCIGAHEAGQTALRSEATPYLLSIPRGSVVETNHVAWTQYGLFRMSVFASGVMFDESGPFGGPGWGFEDNDLAFQMLMRGYRIQAFTDCVYLHRAKRSSIRNMLIKDIDVVSLYQQRKLHVLRKWSEVQDIAEGPLRVVREHVLKLN